MKANDKVRECAKKAGVKHWQIAMRLGISEQTLVRKLRLELPPQEHDNIISVINALAAENAEVS